MSSPADQREWCDRSVYANGSMVVAIASLPAALIVGLGVILGLAAISLGILGRRSAKRSLANFGILVGAVGVMVSIATLTLWLMLWHSSQ